MTDGKQKSISGKPIVIIGGGPAGYKSALEIRKQLSEQKIIVIEKNKLGGTCLHVGCIPSKMLHSIDDLKNYPRALKKNRMILEKGIAKELEEANVEFINAEASLDVDSSSPEQAIKVSVNNETLDYSHLVIATGSKPRTLEAFPEALNSDSFFTEENAKALADPEKKNFCFIGGGYIGVELASMLAKHGKKVRIVEVLDNILAFLDPFMRGKLETELKRSGIEILTGVKDLSSLDIAADETVFVSIGRDNCLAGSKSQIVEASKNSENIHILGDASEEIALAHFAYAQARDLAYKLAGKKLGVGSIDKDKVPLVIFSHPELASIGPSFEAAKEKYGMTNIEEQIIPWASNGKARISGNERGYTKWLIHKSNNENRVIGCSIIGNGACDLISIAVPIVNMELEIKEMKHWIYPHPTLGEIFAF